MSKKIYQTETFPELSIVNNETGEIISGVSRTVCTDQEDFIMCFLQSIGEIAKLDGNTIRVLMWCWKFSSFNQGIADGNIVVNNKLFRDRVHEAGGELTDAIIRRALKILVDKGLLIKKCAMTYMLNPKYFFKGTLTDRSKIIRTIEYNPLNN